MLDCYLVEVAAVGIVAGAARIVVVVVVAFVLLDFGPDSN